ncbi:histidine utilization repressor [Rhizobium sp. CSW-27]|uniref:histidine utilization repressor n=1 Tax=Rhizobium sp. CSW-27 TaxID=2839985 RepID=UPI001C01F254|nr:histidine utilization repressor [Rhizobium sp. CSW-27]MBT9371810.1 histidine utilization repressor [Rhizobium sp. CSW-27]
MDSTPQIPVPRHSDSGSAAPVSLHRRILQDIEGNILSGRWPAGHRIPSEQALTETYGCSRMTVNKVLTELARAGLLLRRRKTGSVVMPQDGQSAILEIYDIGEEVRALNLAYRHRVLSRTVRRPTKTEQALSTLPARARVLAISVLHLAGEAPFCLEERIINLSIASEAETEAFETLAPGQWLLKHVPWSAAEHRISAEAASAGAAAALCLPRSAPVLVVERQTWRLEETVTRVRLTYPGSQHALTARFTPLHGRQSKTNPS